MTPPYYYHPCPSFEWFEFPSPTDDLSWLKYNGCFDDIICITIMCHEYTVFITNHYCYIIYINFALINYTWLLDQLTTVYKRWIWSVVLKHFKTYILVSWFWKREFFLWIFSVFPSFVIISPWRRVVPIFWTMKLMNLLSQRWFVPNLFKVCPVSLEK
jgi:hypothetical protein